MSTDLNSWGSWFDAYNPFTDSDAYAKYKETLPKGVFPVDESDWRQSAFQENLKGKHRAYQSAGGDLGFKEWSNDTTTAPYRASGVNEQTINRNIARSGLDAANAASKAQGGDNLSQADYAQRVQSGDIKVPGYNTNIGTPDNGSNRANTDKNFSVVYGGKVPALPEEKKEVIKPDLGAADINTKTGAATNAKGDGLGNDADNKGIFDKASDLFGDLFSAADLKRMTLYTLGGIATGGSVQGSFKWAGMTVMKEQMTSKKAAADKAKGITDLFNKAPKQVKLQGKNKAVQAVYVEGNWYDANTKVKIDGDVTNWNESSHGMDSNIERYNAMISSARTGLKNEDGTDVVLGDTDAAITNRWMATVQGWNKKGYGIDITDPRTRGAFRVAVERSLQANINFEEGKGRNMVTPEHFFEATLIQGMSPGGDKLFKDRNNDFMSSDGTQALVADVTDMIDIAKSKPLTNDKGEVLKDKNGKVRTGTSSLATVMTQLHTAWNKLSDKERAKYNDDAPAGYSGFSTFAKDVRSKA